MGPGQTLRWVDGERRQRRKAVRVFRLKSPMGTAVAQAAEGVARGTDRGTGELLKESNEAGISTGVAAPEGQAADAPASELIGVGQQCAAVDSCAAKVQLAGAAMANPMQCLDWYASAPSLR